MFLRQGAILRRGILRSRKNLQDRSVSSGVWAAQARKLVLKSPIPRDALSWGEVVQRALRRGPLTVSQISI